jgi:hypothetical protein
LALNELFEDRVDHIRGNKADLKTWVTTVTANLPLESLLLKAMEVVDILRKVTLLRATLHRTILRRGIPRRVIRNKVILLNRECTPLNHNTSNNSSALGLHLLKDA